MNRKSTAWKKNRRLGDVAGGRRKPKFEDNIRRREHSLKPPAPGQETPVLIEENPSRDFYFPVRGVEVLAYLRTLPEDDVLGLTHVWMRRVKTRQYADARRPLAEYIWGSGLSVIVLYPWPRDRVLRFGRKRPSARSLRAYRRWTTDLVLEDGVWCLRWTSDAVHDFYLQGLVAHEVGHHCDPELITVVNPRPREEFAEQYALRRMAIGEEVRRTGDEV